MKLKIIFFCTTCEYFNTMNLGTSKFNMRQTEYDNLMEAILHVSDDETHHNVEARIVEDKD